MPIRLPLLFDCPVCEERKRARITAGVVYFICGHMVVPEAAQS